MSKKESFVFYTSVWPQLFKILENDEERGQLIMVIIDYVSFGTLPSGTHSRAFLGAFEIIKEQLDKDAIKWQQTAQVRTENGKKGGLAKASNAKQNLANASNCYQTLANDSKSKQSQANQAVNVNVDVNVNDNVNGNVNEITTTQHARPTNLDVIEYFGQFLDEDKAGVQAWRWCQYNEQRGWDCLPDWKTAAERWIEKI